MTNNVSINLIKNYLRLSERNQNKVFTVLLILALGYLYTKQLEQKDKTYQDIIVDKNRTIKRLLDKDSLKDIEIKEIYDENHRLWSNPTEKVETYAKEVNKLTSKIIEK